MSKPVIRKPEIPKDHKIQGWIDDRFGVPNTVNIQAYKDILSWGIDYCYKEMLKELGEWVDMPIKRGNYWVSPFCEGKYIKPRIISVIDYQRPDRGLEVQYEFPRDTIPVKTFCEEYYPKAKWMFIPEPEWQALQSQLEEGSVNG